MSDLYKIEVCVKMDSDALVGDIKITDKLSGVSVFPSIGEILDNLSTDELDKLIVRIENIKRYREVE